MTEPIQNYARIGIVHFMAYKACIGGEGPIVETLEKIATDPYFQVVEVSHMKDATVRAQARDLLKSAHMDVAFGAQPILLMNKYNINSPDATHRKEAIAAVKTGIDQAEELGSSGCTLLSNADPGDEAREAGLDLLVDSLSQLCEYAGAKGMDIALETFDRLPFGKNCIVGPNALGVEVSNRLRRQYPNFGLLLDLSHFPLQGESTAYSLNIARDHIVQMHLGNCVMTNPDHPAYGDNHPRFGCEDGENDVPEVVEFLKELLNIGYLDPEKRPILSFEVAPMPGESSEVIIANSKRVLDEAWALV